MSDSSEMFSLSINELQKRWLEIGPFNKILPTFFAEVVETNHILFEEVAIVVAITLAFTFHRYFLTILFLKPISKFLDFNAKNELKFCESCCKLLYYSCFFVWEYYTVNILYPELRYSTKAHWEGWHKDMDIPNPIKYLYFLEAGFYFHSIFATVFMDVWKKDSIAMIIHHILANTLIIFSMSTRYHCIGLIVMYLHDPADIALEGSKLVICFNSKKQSSVLEIISSIGFLIFTWAWFYFRLWVFPQLVLFSSLYTGFVGTTRPFYFPFNIMLFMLFILNVYWFHFIVALIVRIALGKSNCVDDVREYEDGSLKKKN
ncbi:ceramide synthase 1 [Hydra vulgaris]|uniref:ceramide synthase 1 n=1 Tax=Hydra vulgaris TaxID=6087 RepID=UPI0006411844|nr:ceramide synthase 1 [Hydra vulgaris]